MNPAPDQQAQLQELLDLVKTQSQQLAELRAQLQGPARVAVTVQEAADMLHCKRAKVFQLLKQGHIQRAARAGRSTMVTVESLTKYQLQPAKPAPQAPTKPARKPRTLRASKLQDTRAAIRAVYLA